jgi:hypothetical protein
MFRSYGHLQAQIYTWKLTRLLCDVIVAMVAAVGDAITVAYNFK